RWPWLKNERRFDVVNVVVLHRLYLCPAGALGYLFRAEFSPASTTDDDVRLAGDDNIFGVLDDALPGARFGGSFWKDVLHAGNTDQLGHPADWRHQESLIELIEPADRAHQRVCILAVT
ncbi:MAG: hypothetical protein ABJ082_07055, partial [Parasphingorhabdus sp.]